jgi:hypothetical protein
MVTLVELYKLQWVRRVDRIGDKNAYRIFIGVSLGMHPLVRPKRKR